MSLVAVVVPWFGEYCRGGAERLAGIACDLLSEVGHDVEILTTTSKSFDSDWATSFYDAGSSIEDGRHVRRFEVSGRDRRRFDEVNRKILAGEPLGVGDEHVFLHDNINSLTLNREIARGLYDLYLYLPYLYGTTLFGLLHNQSKSLVMPLLHDEGYARLRLVARSLMQPIGGAFLSSVEQDLFHELYGQLLPVEMVVPVPIRVAVDDDLPPPTAVPPRYILYAGRKDQGKNLAFAFETLSLVSATDVGLVLIGGGSCDIPERLAARTLDLGYVDEVSKQALMKNAVCLIHPSLFESFSIVVAEANTCGVPVIVHQGCPVLREYVRSSQGGVAVGRPEDAATEIDRWVHDRALAGDVGLRGKRFVEREFAWDTVRHKLASFINLAKEPRV